MRAAAPRDERAAAERPDRRHVSFRVPGATLDLLDRAAERTHQDRTSFVLGAAVEKAGEVLRDQTVFPLSDADYGRFVAALDDPPKVNERLKALMGKKPLWERG